MAFKLKNLFTLSLFKLYEWIYFFYYPMFIDHCKMFKKKCDICRKYVGIISKRCLQNEIWIHINIFIVNLLFNKLSTYWKKIVFKIRVAKILFYYSLY